jgi:hypothetical protein
MKRSLRYLYLRTVRQSGSPEQIAGGMALGIFLGIAAPPGVQMVLAFALASFLGLNRPMAVAAVFISNPFTMPFIYPLALEIGVWISGVQVRNDVPLDEDEFWGYVLNFRAHGRAIILMLTGCAFMGAVGSIAGYYATKYAVIGYRIGRQHSRQHRRQRRIDRAKHEVEEAKGNGRFP